MDTVARSRPLREQLGLTRAAWARVLGVSERTVIRWEDEDTPPGGLANLVMGAIGQALERVAPAEIKARLEMGVGTALFFGLTSPAPRRR